MNYLAHFLLSGDDPHMLAGALLGDVVKGELRGDYPATVERGIRLHRAVDSFTDRHPTVLATCKRFAPPFRRFAGIALDIAYDQQLALHWGEHAEMPLDEYADSVCQALESVRDLMPPAACERLDRIRQHRLLTRLIEPGFPAEALAGIGRYRLRRANPLHRIGAELVRLSEPIAQGFRVLWPVLLALREDT